MCVFRSHWILQEIYAIIRWKNSNIIWVNEERSKWKWEKKHQEAFNQVKALFIENNMLHQLQREGTFAIFSDASDRAIGSILYQDSEGSLRLITYVSRVFKVVGWHYSTSEKEILTIVYIIVRNTYNYQWNTMQNR